MPAVERRRLQVTGTVQGVGFRPFVYRQAVALGLVGFVRNDSAGVVIEVEGTARDLARLGRRLRSEAPPLARVASLSVTVIPPTGCESGFAIVDSEPSGAPSVPVSVDTATCADCLSEADDPRNRRYRYPFINCTNCGPRYTIVTGVPYDRPATTMASFTMCPDCRREYDDPGNRRFHAQPNACAVCGPRLSWLDVSGHPGPSGPGALAMTVTRLVSGAIVAVKGLGGFHLAVDATDDAAVAELRRRKARDDKPFAVMVANLAAASALCRLDPAAQAVLTSPRRPIVVAPRRSEAPVASGVAPGLPDLGLMLPYSALHHLLLDGVRRPLVMTSGNLSDDPIAYRDDDAVARLGSLVDGLLTHDRPIHIRCDDSVVRSSGGSGGGDAPAAWSIAGGGGSVAGRGGSVAGRGGSAAGRGGSVAGLQVLRRSRGYAPEPMALPVPARRPVLALGAELKNTIAVARDRWLVASHHIGDLEHLATYQSFTQAAAHMSRLYGIVPDVVAHDLHPEYLSTKLALELDLPAWGIQHHHAHVAACLFEHGFRGPVLGIAFDGLGYGADGTLWGGEFLIAGLDRCRRVGHLGAVRMPGGSAAVREPWRMALSWAHAAMGADAAAGLRLDERAGAVLALVEGSAGPLTSSVGRLFDAVAALAGVRGGVSYEGQAAIELEAAARRVPPGQAVPYPATWGPGDGVTVLDPRPMVAAVIADRARGAAVEQMAASFHEGLAAATVGMAVELAGRNRMDTVALSGGVFQNARLTGLVAGGLAARGLRVLTHREVPANDGGISVGQAAIAATAEALPVLV